MVRKSRSDKKDTTCKRCGKVCVNPNKLREHLRRKNPCKPLTVNQEAIQETIQPPIQTPIQISIQTPPIQESNQQPIQEAIQKPVQIPNKDTLFKNPDIEWNFKELKGQLSTFENLQQEICCRPEEFDRKRFYLEMKKEVINHIQV